ncbi:MAG: hypothetical protein ABIG68_02825 [Acidobacteriota bacterium]
MKDQNCEFIRIRTIVLAAGDHRPAAEISYWAERMIERLHRATAIQVLFRDLVMLWIMLAVLMVACFLLLAYGSFDRQARNPQGEDCGATQLQTSDGAPAPTIPDRLR